MVSIDSESSIESVHHDSEKDKLLQLIFLIFCFDRAVFRSEMLTIILTKCS